MGVIVVRHRGSFNNVDRFLSNAKRADLKNMLSSYGAEGVRALSSATPIDSGETARSWDYNVRINRASVTLSWTNSNINKGVPIAIIIQYGHATGTGGYVQGRDYINPAIQPIFDKIAESVWGEITR